MTDNSRMYALLLAVLTCSILYAVWSWWTSRKHPTSPTSPTTPAPQVQVNPQVTAGSGEPEPASEPAWWAPQAPPGMHLYSPTGQTAPSCADVERWMAARDPGTPFQILVTEAMAELGATEGTAKRAASRITKARRQQ